MSAERQEFQLSSTFVINQADNKVLYAKVTRDFVDVLLSFLTLPLGTLVRLLVRHYGDDALVLGSLGHMYRGLENLDTSNFYFEMCKWMLLEPRNSFEVSCRKLKLNMDGNTPIKYYVCPEGECNFPKFVSLYYDNMTCECGRRMNLEVGIEDPDVETPSEGGVFVPSQTQYFIVTDDFRIIPYLPESELEILRAFGVDRTDVLQESNVIFGYSKMMILLKCLLVSKTPLTDTVLNEREMIFSRINTQFVPFEHQKGKHYLKSNSKTMRVTAFVQTSTNRILAVHAQKDFVHFVFSLLAIPLGKVEFLLDSNSCLGSVDNLYRSVPNLIGRKRRNTRDHSINSILNPQLAPKYVSWFNQVLPLTEERSHALFYSYDDLTKRYSYKMSTLRSTPADYSLFFSRTINPKGLKPNGFLVTDNLDVTIAFSSSLSRLQRTGIPIRDLEKHVLDVGKEEAVNILKASLTSPYALTNGLQQCLRRHQRKKSELSKVIRVPRWC